MDVRRLALLGALTVVATFAACTLNPQPLPPLAPPEDNQAEAPAGDFGAADAGTRGDDAPSSDAGEVPLDSGRPDSDADSGGGVVDAGDDAGDAGDAGID